MANWGKQLSAEEILGMKPDDLRAKLDSSVTKEDLNSATQKIDGLETTLSSIQQALAKLTTPPEVQDPNVKLDMDDPTTQILTDPSGYVMRQTQGINDTALSARADVLEMRARSKYGSAFAKYNDELSSSAAKFSLQQRAQEGFWDFHIRTFMGDKYIKGETQGSYPSLVGPGSFVPGTSEPNDPNKGLDPEVAGFLKERGVPLEKAAAIKKLMNDGGDPIDIASYKKAVNA